MCLKLRREFQCSDIHQAVFNIEIMFKTETKWRSTTKTVLPNKRRGKEKKGGRGRGESLVL